MYIFTTLRVNKENREDMNNMSLIEQQWQTGIFPV